MKNTQNTKNLGKDSVNRKSSIIFIQLGLVFALVLTYIAIESKTISKNDINQASFASVYDMDEEIIPDTTPEPPKEEPKKAKPEPEPILDDPEIIKDDSNEKETVIDTDLIDPDKETKLIDIDDIDEVNIKEEVIEDVSIAMVSEMPIFPGCKGNNEELKKCLSEKIGRIVRKNFNPDIAQDLGLKPGVQRIFVMFVIDKDGNISNIKSNAPHKSLTKETKRVLGKIPKMLPGKYNGKKVGVKYSLPIRYQIEE